MERALSVTEMREADRRAIEVLGIPSLVLMERAGLAVFERIASGPVTVVCGKGNNGGDGYVVARHALLAGLDTRVIALADDETLTKDALVFKKVYTRLGGTCCVCTTNAELKEALSAVSEDATLIDAMLGTGTRGEVSGLVRCAIEHWPTRKTVAVDIPTGLHGDTGEPCGLAVRADETVTFQFMKKGFAASTAAPYLGRLHVADIGIPDICGDDARWNEERLES
ncbi:MAG: NAD(P)H-hydrate epimerase [Candidatus Hydrogenedentota bacterium]